MGITHLKPGMPAPDFEALDDEGKPFRLSDLRGKKVILYFYPKDDTPGCTNEAISLSHYYDCFRKLGYEIVGVSIDSVESHQKFKQKYNIPFKLIADTDKKVVQLYGVWGEKKRFGKTYYGTHRVTFIIDENGVIRHVIEKVDTKHHAEQIAQLEGINLEKCEYENS